MDGEEEPVKKKRRLLGIVFSFLSLAVFTLIAISLISGRGLPLSRLVGFLSPDVPGGMSDEFFFNVGRNRAFAELASGSLAAAGTLGIQVLDSDGSELLRDPYRMSSPALVAESGKAIAFDIGGSAVRVFNKSEIIASIESRGAIVSASINQNGWFCVCSQDGGGFGGSVTVYNSRGGSVFRFDSGVADSGYILSAVLSPDNRSMAVLTLAGNGSKVTIFSLDEESSVWTTELSDVLALDIRVLPSGNILVISTQSLFTIDINGEVQELYEFSDRRLVAYLLDGGFITLHLLDYGVGYNGRLITLGADGTLLGQFVTDREIVSMSSGGGYLAVLRSDGAVFFSAELSELHPSDESLSAAGAIRILALDRGAALAAGDHSAVVIGISDLSGGD